MVFGTSSGTIIAIWLALEHPGAIRGAVLHEPPLIGVLPDPDRLQAQLMPVIEPAMTSGGPRTAMEAFVRFVSGDAAVDALDLKLRERALANAETFFVWRLLADHYAEGAQIINSAPIQAARRT